MSEIHHYWYDDETKTPRRCDDADAWLAWWKDHDAALCASLIDDVAITLVFDPHVVSEDATPMPFIVYVTSQYAAGSSRFATFAGAKSYFDAAGSAAKKVHSVLRERVLQ